MRVFLGRGEAQLWATIVEAGSDVFVSSPDVRRMLLVRRGDEFPPTAAGDVIFEYVEPGTEFFTDFAAATPGELPTGWSMPWHTSSGGLKEVVQDGEVNVLRVQAPVGGWISSRRAIVWDGVTLGEYGKFEVYARIRSSGTLYPFRVGVGLRGDDATETGLAVGITATGSSPTLSVSGWDGGELVGGLGVGPGVSEQWQPGVMAHHRVQVDGNTVRQRLWFDDESEPETWGLVRTGERLGEVASGGGHVGVVYTGTFAGDGHTDLVALGVGLGVTPAPKEAL